MYGTVKINYTMKIITAYITKKIIPIIFANIIPVRNDTVPFFFKLIFVQYTIKSIV